MALTHGTEIPNAGESGNIFCPKLERNWARYDAHDHTGGDKGSMLDPGTAFTKQTDKALIAGWALDANDVYKQDITLPTGYDYDTTFIRTLISDEEYNLRIEKVSSSIFTIYCNDNTVDVDIVYM